MELAPVRGTRDFYPDDLRLRTWLFDHFRAVAASFGFEEYDAPVLESEELYTRKAGEEITGQLYSFEDKGGRRVALRPEMTPSLARLVLQKKASLSLPLKWFSLPQCWRYERTTRGRRREHYQWNMDVLGVERVTAEAELLAAITSFFGRIGLGPEDVRIRVSDRAILQAVLESVEVPEGRFAEVCVLVDKLEKLPREAIEEELGKLGLGRSSVGRILDALSLKSIADLAPVVGEDNPAIARLTDLWSLAEAYGYVDWLVFDASVVRGLAYYTGTVFEAFDRKGELRAICGGGRYDRLLSTFGGEDLPACGFGFGDVVILELLAERGLMPELPPSVDDVVLAFDEDLRGPAARVARALRESGRRVDLVLEKKRLKWAFRQAERVGASRLVFVAPEEWERGRVKVRDVASGDETEVAFDALRGEPS